MKTKTNSNRDLYETNKLSNFLTLLIMIVIILAVYKSCAKNRELEPRLDLTYAHVFNGNDQTQLTPAGLFPPPPPPYQNLDIPSLNPNQASNKIYNSSPAEAVPTSATGVAVGSVGGYLFNRQK